MISVNKNPDLYSDNSSDSDELINTIMNEKKILKSTSEKSSVVSAKDADFIRREREEDDKRFKEQQPRITVNKFSYDEDDDEESKMSEPKHFSKNDDISEVSSWTGNDLSKEEVMKKKRFYLSNIDKYIRKGMESKIHASMHSNLEELKLEYESIKKDYDVSNCLDTMRSALVTTCHSIEKLNKFCKDNVVDTGILLDGWSEDVYSVVMPVNKSEEGGADTILEELYEKHYDKLSGWSPEAKLSMFLGQIAMQKHYANVLAQKYFKDTEMSADLKQKVTNLIASETVNEQKNFINQVNRQTNQTMGHFGVQPLPEQRVQMEDPLIDPELRELLGDDDFEINL